MKAASFIRHCLAAALGSLLVVTSVFASQQVRVEFYPLVGKKGAPIVAEYQGRRYQPPRSLKGVTAKQLELPEERFLLHMMNTIRRGTLEQFIALWERRDQDAVRRYYHDKKGLWEKLQGQYNQVPDQRLVNLMHYGKYSMVQVLKLPPKLHPYVSTVVFETTRDGLRLSNDLDGDAVHAYFATEFATRLVEEFLASRKAKKD